MKITFVLDEDPIDEEERDRLHKSILKFGYVPNFLPKNDLILGRKQEWQRAENYIVYFGNLFDNKRLRKSTKGLFVDECNFETDTYYMCFRPWILNSDHFYVNFEELVHSHDWIMNVFNPQKSIDDKIFIRPNSGMKIFDGHCLSRRFAADDLSRIKSWSNISSYELVLCSSFKPLGAEYRVFIANDEPITGSQYKLKEEPLNAPCPKSVMDFAQEVALGSTLFKESFYSMDICEHNGELKLLEINSGNCCGIYQSDTDLIVQSVIALAVADIQGLS